MRPIDGDALRQRFNEECIGECACCQHAIGDVVNMHCKLIEEATTLDVDPVIHAKWIYSSYMYDSVYICSHCQTEIEVVAFDRIPSDRCPKCGAYMNADKSVI